MTIERFYVSGTLYGNRIQRLRRHDRSFLLRLPLFLSVVCSASCLVLFILPLTGVPCFFFELSHVACKIFLFSPVRPLLEAVTCSEPSVELPWGLGLSQKSEGSVRNNQPWPRGPKQELISLGRWEWGSRLLGRLGGPCARIWQEQSTAGTRGTSEQSSAG